MKKIIILVALVFLGYLIYKGGISFLNNQDSFTISVDKKKAAETLKDSVGKVKPAINKTAEAIEKATEE